MKSEQIKAIREEYTGLRDLPRRSLASSIKTLADDLYAKDTHFIFELIQNAEDNEYQTNKSPSLRFKICQQEIMGKTETILAVHNNEVGFHEKHVRAICQVGQSTKSKAQGYIGEKGIGFKSVFRITSSPYVFSKGYQFCLPERDEETELGYIVPKWVENGPISTSTNETTIILPLNKNKKDIQSVSIALREIAPETILFLQKLTSLEISIQLPDAEYEVVAEKRVVRQSGASQLIELSYMQWSSEADEDIVEISRYWLTEQEFHKPSYIQHEKRVGIETRIVSVAIPLNQQNHQGKLFAYLPVWEQTGLPFLINADFLLVSSREGIREDEEWNHWLRDCVTETYTRAFLSLLTDKQLALETRVSVYSTIPIATHRQFLEPVVASIKKRLAELDCVLTLPGEETVRPEQARLCHETIRRLLGPPSDFPECLRKEFRISCPEIESFKKQLKSIGTKEFLLSDVRACLNDSAWIQSHPFSWFIDIFRFLRKQHFENGDLHDYRIIPLEQHGNENVRFSCTEVQPIYFPVDPKERETIAEAPCWLSNLVVIDFVHSDFYAELKKQEDYDDLRNWLTEQLDIYTFSAGNYAIDILNAISIEYQNFSEEQLVEAANFLFLHSNRKKFDWDTLPIILADGRKMRLQETRNLTFSDSGETINAIVVPENFNPDAGWQHIWTTSQDRLHFLALSNCYVQMHKDWFSALKIQEYPPFRRIEYDRYWAVPENLQEEKKMAWECNQRSANGRESEIRVTSYVIPSHLNGHECSANLSNALQKLLNTSQYDKPVYQGQKLIAQGTYQYRGKNWVYRDSTLLVKLRSFPWLPTTKGLVAPREAFLPLLGVEEVLGQTVPYFNGKLPTDVIEFLKIQSEVSVEKILGILQNNSGRMVDPELPHRLYKELSNRSDAIGVKSAISKAFAERPLIVTKGDQNNYLWHKIDDCVWEDTSEILEGDFAYLERQYPKLRDFFISTVGVKERVDTECFAKRLLSLQQSPLSDIAQQRILIEKIYRKLKPVTKEPKEIRPVWWIVFSHKAKLYSQSDKFCEPDALLVPDDGELRRIFVKHDDVEYTWRPGDDSFNDWLPFYKAFGIPLLSDSITKSLKECYHPEYLGKNTFVTVSAVQMVAAWLREKRRADYDRLLSEKVFQQLFSLREERTEKSIQVGYHLETDSYDYGDISEEYPVFWDVGHNTLYYTSSAEKDQLAKELASGILSADNQELASWIENVLESVDTKRLKRQGWNVPREISAMCGKEAASNPQQITDDSTLPVADDNSDKNPEEVRENIPLPAEPVSGIPCPQSPTFPPAESSPANRITGNDDIANNISPVPGEEASGDDENKQAGDVQSLESRGNDGCQPSAPGDHEKPHINYGDEIKSAFDKDGKTKINDDSASPGATSVKNPGRRGQALTDKFRDEIENEPSPKDRRRPREGDVLEEPNYDVRSALLGWYNGKCQICKKTWPKRNGEPFFAANYLVNRRHARWLDNPGNALCLCAEHSAQWQHAAKQPTEDIPTQISKLRLKAEGGAGDLVIHFRMLNVECMIHYDERHFLELRTLLSLSKEMDNKVLCPLDVKCIDS